MSVGGKNPKTVDDNLVVSMDYTLRVEGEIIDSSEGEGPIEFIQGLGHIVPGLESALYGMAIGESKQVKVPPADGYGEEDQDAYADIPRSEFPDEIPLEPGVELQLRNQDGEEMEALIDSVGADSVRLNFNHPLAGKTLDFDVTVAGLRHATEEEIEHGHVHSAGHHH